MNPLYFAILAAVSLGLWTFFHKLASPHINQTLGAILVSLTAVILGSIFVLFRQQNIFQEINSTGLFYIFLAGVSALCLDVFILSAYSKGLPLSIGGPIVIGGSTLVAVLCGILFLNETMTLLKTLGILLILTGSIILSIY